MNVLVTGAGGFIGRHVCSMLEADGCTVRRAGREMIDFGRIDVDAWRTHVEGVDVVVNAAGIFREAGGATFEQIHADGPIALFALCAERAIPVVQISALGADEHATTRFHRTKKRADDALLALDVPSIVLLPSLVFGTDGASASTFMAIASMPVIPLPGGGMQAIQPVHVDDVAAAVAATVARRYYPRSRVACVGRSAMALRDYLDTLRGRMGLGPARFAAIPMPLVRTASRLRIGLLDPDALAMLERGNTADPVAFAVLLGRAPRAASGFIESSERASARLAARLQWTVPLLRFAIAAMWIAAGVTSAWLYPINEGYALLAPTGLHGVAATIALYGAAVLDIAIGIATLILRRRKWLWRFQIAVIVGYTAIISVFLPEQWLHPYGPVVKNLPILAAIVLLSAIDNE